MRRLLPIVLAVVLLPVGAAAQKVPPVAPKAPVVKAAPVQISEAQARATAVKQVQGALAAGKLKAWGGGQGGGIRPTSVTAAGALFNPTGGKNGTPIYVVGVKAPNAKGHVRVTIDARTGLPVGGLVADTLDWGSRSAQ